MSFFLSLCCTGPIIQIMFIVIPDIFIVTNILTAVHCYFRVSSSPLDWVTTAFMWLLELDFKQDLTRAKNEGDFYFFVKTLIMNVCLDGRYRHFPIDNWIYYWMTHSVKLKQIYRKFGSITTELSRLGYTNTDTLSPTTVTVDWNNWHPPSLLSENQRFGIICIGFIIEINFYTLYVCFPTLLDAIRVGLKYIFAITLISVFLRQPIMVLLQTTVLLVINHS